MLFESEKLIIIFCFYDFDFDESDFIIYYVDSEVIFVYLKVFD